MISSRSSKGWARTELMATSRKVSPLKTGRPTLTVGTKATASAICVIESSRHVKSGPPFSGGSTHGEQITFRAVSAFADFATPSGTEGLRTWAYRAQVRELSGKLDLSA